jgi:hypothetical protein
MTTDDSSPVQHTLTDDQIRDYLTTYNDHLRQVVFRTEVMVNDNADREDAEEVAISMESLREMHLAMASMYKTLRDSAIADEKFLAAGANHGNRGSGCDYNPFSHVNFGDGVNH